MGEGEISLSTMWRENISEQTSTGRYENNVCEIQVQFWAQIRYVRIIFVLFRQTFPFSHHSGSHSITVSRKNKLSRADLKTCNYPASQWSKIFNAWFRMWIYTAICRKQIGKLIGYQYSSNWKWQKANIGTQVWYNIRWKREKDIYATTPL